MTQSQVRAFNSARHTIAITDDMVFEIVKKSNGITQEQTYTIAIEKRDLSDEQKGRIYQQVSRSLSNLARQGLLDDSESVKNSETNQSRTLYRTPAAPLAARKTKLEVLREENEALQSEVKRLKNQVEFLIMMRDKAEAEAAKKTPTGNTVTCASVVER
jgi:hypothetical protein